MAYVLSLQPHSPLKRSFSDSPYLDPCSPLNDTLARPLNDITARKTSLCSLYSFKSARTSEWARGNENTPKLTSQSLLDLVPESKGRPSGTGHVVVIEQRRRHYPAEASKATISRAPTPSDLHSRKATRIHHIVASSSSSQSSIEVNIETDDGTFEQSESLSFYEAISTPLPRDRSATAGSKELQEEQQVDLTYASLNTQPFRRWMSTLRRRHVKKEQHPQHAAASSDAKNGQLLVPPPRGEFLEPAPRNSESMSSSIGCVTAMKSATMTVGSTSIVPRSDMGLQGKARTSNRSNNYSEIRRSLESHQGALGPIIDESAWRRSLQRRKIVEELIASEESYVADLKVLINDYFTILTALPALPGQTKSSIQQNITQILQLHEDLLADLHQAIPQVDFTKSANIEAYPVTKAKHIRFHSVDIIPGRFTEHKGTRRLRHSLEIGRSPDRRPRGLVTDTKTAGNIAKIFNRHMKRFFTYEEYGAHWTTMSQDLTIMCKGLQGWQDYERGIEALQKIIASENNRDAGSKKALTFADLLIKPIQRVCKYPLLFDDLCRNTPVYDDPEAHGELEKALFRIQETIREVNKAKDDPKTRRLIEITWQLQDRLVFQEEKISRALVFRLLGHVLLCGVLHVAYQTPDRVKGQYMICVLYKSCLILATTNRYHSPYTVVASIGLANGSIEEPDNGRGLQCHNAPHTWKFVFEHGHRLNEIILSACALQEEETWKKQLHERIVSETNDFVEGHSAMQDMFSSLSLEIKSLGPVFGHADSLVRRMSVHRAATVGAKTNMSQVIIKNTQAQKAPESPATFSPSMITRSRSHMSSNHVPILAPRRADRIRLETALEDVWTKDILLFPGMSNRRVENQIRASANSVMRKLSMASIASNFSRRSPSLSSASNTKSEDSFGSRSQKTSQGNLDSRSMTDRRNGPAVVDFHNAPNAFLPADFELHDTRPLSRRRRLANRTLGAEGHTVDRLSLGRTTRARRLSTNIINLPRSSLSIRVAEGLELQRSDATILPTSEPPLKLSHSLDLGKRKREERNSSLNVTPVSKPPSNKAGKNKSRIFRFWTT